ncbi:MAG: HAD family phosphatase [Bacillota bacterium]|nr:HAD family phosphatase [Bacillota bacterium]
MPEFRAAVFDLDGTLIDSMRVWDEIARDFLLRRGAEATREFREKIIPMSYYETAEYMIKVFNLDEKPEDIVAHIMKTAAYEYAHSIRLKPYAEKYLRYLKDGGIKLAVATASPETLYVPVLKNNGVYGLFDAFVTLGEVSRPKSFPDIYLLAAEKLKVPPSECAVFEDIPEGIKGAKSAGMKAIGVFDETSEKYRKEMEALSDGYIVSFREMLPD